MDKAGAQRAIADGAWEEVLGWAAALSEPGLLEARRWYRSSLRAAARREATRSWQSSARAVQLVLAIALSETPEEASKNCAWGREVVAHDEYGALPRVSSLLVRRGPAWAVEFANLAASTVIRGESSRAAAEIAAVLLPVFGHFDMPVPTGTLPWGWAQLARDAHVRSTATSTHTWVPLRIAHVDDSGVGRAAYGLPTTLLDVLRSTPRLGELLAGALATPNALAEWNGLKHADWDVAAAIERLVGEKVLDRTALIDNSLAALARSDKPSAQRTYAAVLRGASFAAADVQSRLAFVRHLMPMVHGSVTATLLPAVLAGEPDEDVLLDVGSVVLARPEKAQKVALLTYLTRRPGSPGVNELLAMAAEDADTSFAARARSAIGPASLHLATAPRAVYRWEVDVTGRRPAPFVQWPADPAGYDAALSDLDTWLRITSTAQWLDMVTRYGARDLAGLTKAVLARPAPEWWVSNRVAPLLHQWCSGGGIVRSYISRTTSMTYDHQAKSWVTQVSEPSTRIPPGFVHFTDGLIAETLSRLGTMRELLSTPTYADGSLSMDDLVDRLRRTKRAGVAPYDLVQALLRLTPTDPGDAARFRRISVDVTMNKYARRRFAGRARVLDAGEVVGRWIASGGIPVRHVEATPTGVLVPKVHLPLPPELAALDGIAALCAPKWISSSGSRGPLTSSADSADYLGVVPLWTDAAATMLGAAEGLDSVFTVQRLTFISSAAGPLALGAHRLLARLQSHPRPDSRLKLVDSLVRIAQQGRLDPSLLREQTVAAFRDNALSLTRLAHTWEHAFQSGLMKHVWPSSVAILGEALRQERAPAGLADLIRAMTPAIPTVLAHSDDTELPPELRVTAASRSKTKTAEEARALLAVADAAIT